MNEKSFDILSVLGREASLKTFIEYKRRCSELVNKYTQKIENSNKERDD